MTQFSFCRLLCFATLKGFTLLSCLLLSGKAVACDLPGDFPQAYLVIYEFTKNLKVESLHGVDECLATNQNPLKWNFQCDSSGKFLSASSELFLLPKITFSFNEKEEFALENFYFADWSYSKVDDSELAEVHVRRDKELKIIYTTQSARKVHLTLVKDNNNKLKTLETLVYKMNIGKPTLEAKFSCSNM